MADIRTHTLPPVRAAANGAGLQPAVSEHYHHEVQSLNSSNKLQVRVIYFSFLSKEREFTQISAGIRTHSTTAARQGGSKRRPAAGCERENTIFRGKHNFFLSVRSVNPLFSIRVQSSSLQPSPCFINFFIYFSFLSKEREFTQISADPLLHTLPPVRAAANGAG
jgi:hypothetical protein